MSELIKEKVIDIHDIVKRVKLDKLLYANITAYELHDEKEIGYTLKHDTPIKE